MRRRIHMSERILTGGIGERSSRRDSGLGTRGKDMLIHSYIEYHARRLD